MAEQEGVYQRVINAIGAITLSPDEGKCIIEFVEGAIHGLLPLKRIPKEISDLTYEIGSGLHSDCQSGVDDANARLVECFQRGRMSCHGQERSCPIWNGIDRGKCSNGFDDYIREGPLPNLSSPIFSPCPFCGAGSVSVHTEPFNISTYVVACSNCGAKGPIAETSVESVTRWNIGATNIKNQ